MKTIYQYKLTRTLTTGAAVVIAWLDRDLKIGDRVTLKEEPGVWWDIVEKYRQAAKYQIDKQRKWQNPDYRKHKGNILN